MKHLDLFSGIGGGALAVDAVWSDAEHIFVEIDPYCQALLKKRFPNSPIHGDIRTFGLDTYPNGNGRTVGQKEIDPTKRGEQALHDVEGRFDLLTGGFPCQPFSQAGRRKGTADNRYLWPEMLRVIREFRPRWIVGENVAGLLTIEQGMVFEQVCADLEAEGYEVQPFVIPAVAINAPHRRDRVWIVAHATGERRDDGFNHREGRHIPADKRASQESESEWQRRERWIGEVGSDASNANLADDIWRSGSGARDREWMGANQQDGTKSRGKSPRRNEIDWNANWLEVATELCGVDDGLPAELDGLKFSKSKHRAERLKGLGNAWVPQVAVEIFTAIKQTEKLV